MGQAVRQNCKSSYQADAKKGKPPAYWNTIQERIECGKAVKVVERALMGDKTLTDNQIKVALFLINKFVPSLQAVAVRIEDNRPTSWADLESLALSHGINPALLLDDRSLIEGEVLDSPQESVDSEQESDPPLPPEAGA